MKINANSISKLNDLLLILFVFALSFEYWDPFGLAGSFSVAKMSAVLYFISWLPYVNKIKIKTLEAYLFPLFLYLIAEFFSSAINSRYVTSIDDAFNFKLLQLLCLLLLISSHLIMKPNLINKVVNVFICSVFLMSILSYFGFGLDVDPMENNGRILLFGENPNLVGMKGSFAILMIFYKLFTKKEMRFGIKLLLIVCLIPLFYLLISTGSRGALLAVFLSLALIVYLQKVSIKVKLVLCVLGFIFSVLLFNYINETNENFSKRINVTLEEGDTGRNEIWDAALLIIEDNLIIGVGKAGAIPVMNEYLGRDKDPHNVYLYVLITSGIVGFSFFMTFIFRLGRDLYKKYKYDKNVLFFVIFLILLFFMFKSGGFINKTFLWFYFALLIGVSQTKSVKEKTILNEDISHIK